MPSSLLPIAMSQLGNNGSKYQSWAGIGNQDWCAAFVSWCANEAGYHMDQSAMSPNIYNNPPSSFPPENFPMYTVCGRGAAWFNAAGRLLPSKAYGGTYTPNPGDIIFFAWDENPYIPELWHTGVVKSVSNGRIYTVEGNNRGGVGISLVREDDYPEYSPDVCWFGVMNGSSLTVTDYVIAAICGNFWRESTVNPGIWESLIPSTWDHVYQYDGIGGYGFGGFTNIAGATVQRLLAYHDWCVANGYSEGDGSAQLYYIIFVERCWKAIYHNDDFDEWLQNTSTDLYQLTDDWCRWWEGNPGDHMDERFAHAQTAYDYIQQHKSDDPSGYTWVTGNFFCSEPQILNNIMCLYFWFTNYYTPGGGGGGGGSDGKRKGRIPIWMMLRNPGLY